VRISSQRWPDDRTTPNYIAVGNPYSKHYEPEKKLDEQRARIRTRDRNGEIVLFPGILATLYWPPGEERKDRLTLEDVNRLAVNLKSVVKDLKPDTVLFDAVICTLDPESQRRVKERNRQMMLRPTAMPPLSVTFNRQPVPITVGALTRPVPKETVTPQGAALLGIVNTCHRRPLSNLPGLVRRGIRETEEYSPAIAYEIGFGIARSAGRSVASARDSACPRKSMTQPQHFVPIRFRKSRPMDWKSRELAEERHRVPWF
jgi:hypothetical protein